MKVATPNQYTVQHGFSNEGVYEFIVRAHFYILDDARFFARAQRDMPKDNFDYFIFEGEKMIEAYPENENESTD